MATDNKRKLYDALSQDYDMGSYEQFCADLSDEGKRRKLYDATSEDYDYGSWDSFSEQLGYGAGELAYEQDGGGANAGTMSAIVGGVAGGIAVGAPPTEERKRAMGRELRQIQAQGEAMFAEGRERMANVSEYYGGNPIGFRTVEGKSVFNPESGTMERTYLTPTGDRTTSKTAADMSTYSFRQAMGAADMSVGAQIRRAEAELAELRKRLDESGSRVHKEWAEDYEKNDAPLAAVLAANTYVSRQSADKENSALRVAIRQREEQLKNLYEERDRQAGKDVGFWRGFGRVVGDGRTWDFGTGDLLDAMTMMNADQYSAPDATEGEKRAGKDMLKAVYDAQQTEQMFGENASFWNRAGVMTGYMPSFMLDFALTGGGFEAIDVAGKAAARGAVRVIGKEAIKEMTELGVKQYAKKYGVRGVGRMAGNWTIKALGTTADDLLIRAPLMTNTVQAGKTAADVIDRKLGDVVVDENGNYDFSNDETWGSAIWQGEANAIIENYSEMFGTHLDGVVPALAKTFGGKRISGMLARANASSYGQILATTRKQFERLGVSDYFGEVGEEYYGQLWRSMLNLDDAYTNVPVYDEEGNQVVDAEGNLVYERKNLLFTGQFHGDIWGGMALSMGLMGAGKYTLSGIAYGSMKHQVNVADRVAAEIFTPDRWEPIREIIDNTTNEDMGALAERMVNDTELSEGERAAVMGYMERSLNLRGLNLGAMAQSRGAEGNAVEQGLNESYIDGYEASSPQEMNDAQNMYEYQRQRLVTELGSLDYEGIDGILSDIDNDPAGALQRTYDPSLREIVLDYANAKILRDGIIQRVNDDIDERIAQSDAMINARVNGASGMIEPAVMGTDDREVYVVGGTLTINEDGTVDRGASDESIIVRDAVTGKLEFVDPKSIVSGGVAIDPEMEKAMAAESIRREAAQAAVDAMNGTLAFNPGDVVEINDGGGLIQATIVGAAVDEESGMPVEGQIAVQLPDGQQTVFAKEQLQAFADAANLERLNRFEQERAAKRAQQQAVEAEAMRPQFLRGAKRQSRLALNDEFTILNDNGTPIRGSITGELDEDGTVEIYTEEPINGNRVNRFTPSELEEMLDTYNGEAIALPVPENVENVPNVEENPDFVEQNSENPTETVPKPEEVVEAEPQASALSRVPVDEQGDPILTHESVDPETAWAGAVEFFGSEEDALTYVNARIKRSEATIATAEKAVGKIKPDGGMNKYREDLKNARAAVEEAKSAHVRWQDIARVQQLRMEEAEAEVAAQKALEESITKGKAELKQAYDEVKDVPEAVAIIRSMEPQSIDEVAALVLSNSKVLWNDEGAKRGLKRLMGYGEGERRGLLGLFATSANGGMSLERLAEDRMQEMCQEYGIAYDNQDAMTALTDVIGACRTRADILKYIQNRRIEQAHQIKQDYERYVENMAELQSQEAYHISTKEVEAYEEYIMSELAERDKVFAESEYNGYIADEMAGMATLTINHNGTESTDARLGSPSGDRTIQEDDTTTESTVSGRGDEILPEPRADISGRIAENEGRPGIQPGNGVQSNGETPALAQGTPGEVEAENSTRTDANHNVTPISDLNEVSGDKGSDFALVEQAIGEESLGSRPADESAERGQTLGGTVAAAEAVVDTDPTEAQKVAGNYRKGHVQVGTFDVTIEQPVGSVRRGTDADGKAWETTMRNTYGYIRGTEGVDGDHIDVFLSTDIDAWNGRRVVIVDQYNPDGSFDEHKVMLGFNDKDEAINAYLANYESGWENGRRLVFSTAALEDFEKWIESSHRKQKPYHKYKIAEKAEVDESTPENPVSTTDYTIDTYTTKKNKAFHRVVFPRADKAVWQERLNLARKMGGTSLPKGYGFKTREEAEAFAKAVADPTAVEDAQPLSLDDMRQLTSEVAAAEAVEPEQTQSTDKVVNPSGNKLVTDERYAELRERMRKKLGGQLNMGVDPEILAIGTEMAVYHIEKGARKFKAYASAMIADLGDAIRPYLKSFYNAVRDMPEAEAAGLVADMDSYDEVRSVDIANFDKPSTDALATAAAIVKEQEVEKEKEVAEVKIKKNRKKKISKSESKPTTDGSLFDTVEDAPTTMPAITVPKARPVADLMGDSAAYQDREAQTVELVEEIGGVIESRVAMLQLDAESVKPLTMTDVKKMASKYPTLKDISDTDLQELVELAMTQLTRSEALVNIDGTAEAQRRAYDHIVDLYQIQPSLNARDSERLIKQQYSTPTPFGFVMGQFVRAGGKTVGSMLEPSAGNGALTITIPPSAVHVNDIDDARLANLRKLGYGRVTAQDALLPFAGDKVDVVMTNPPFGTVTEKVYDGIFRISSLEGQMAINALEQMKDDGRAAIVIGGNTSYRTNGSMNPKDAAFFGYLYSHYNVADVINISGKALYSRNGTGYDVRMILIDGRKTGEFQRVFPPVKAKARAEQVTTFDELYKRVQDDIQQIQQVGSQSANVQREPGTAVDGTASAPVRTGNNRPNTGAGQRPGTTGDTVRDTPRTDSGQPTPGNDGSRPAGVDNAVTGNAGSTDNVPQPKPQQPRSVGSGSTQDGTGRSGSDGRGTVASRPDRRAERLEVKPDLTTEKVPYPNQSENGFTLMSVVPAAQAQVLQKSLGEIAAYSGGELKVGDVDQYLVDELGYSSKEELYKYLAAEQIDSVALAIHQMNKGNAFIIGDMTGVGKGRQGAALIRYAVKQGKVPIYFTQKPTLFTDNYRDLADIGSSDLRPFIIASNPKDANIVDTDGNIVHKLPSKKEQERVFNYIMEHGTLPEEYDYVLTTYDQIKNGTADYAQNEDGTWNTEARKLPKKSKGYTTADYNGQARRDSLAQLAEGNIAILDESHTVGGDSGCGRYMQMLTSSAEGVTFLSATFAKRADNMPIYAQRTAIAEAGVKASELIEAISKGGVTLQEIMSKQLVESGQMIRRERSFEGVTIDWLSVEEEINRRQREQFNEVADIFNAIRNFQDDYITPIIDAKNEAAAEFGATVGHTQGIKDLGVKNVPFASKMYNLVNQLLFALKVDAVADRVIENLRNGYKPVISFTNTMEGFLSSAPKGVAMDDVPNFSLTLMRALDGVMRFTEKDADENTEGGSISLSDLSTEGQNAYNAIREKIINLSADLPISPMDAIRMKIEEAGYSVAEITGRTMQLNRTEDDRYIVEARKDRDKKAAMRDFNSGKLDVLMINKSGSTGISLHASSKFEDQRPRVMVFAQFQSDINDEVQMRGRIDRSGQVTRGRYEYIMSTIPAEQRIQMMFKAKLKSLDANTTSSQKSKFNEMEIVDYLNKYGDDVVWEYMKEHPELEERLGDPLDMLQEKKAEDGPRTSEKEDTSKKTGCAGKISRYLAFLSVEEQDEIFREITEAYRVKIQLLDDAGENDLEITTMPLRAETKRKQIWHEGENPGSGNAFADNTYVEEVEVDVLKKPMKRDEIAEATRRLAGEFYLERDGIMDWEHYAYNKGEEIHQFYQSKADEAFMKLKEAGEVRIAKAREKAVTAATKARGRGENNFTDEQIQSLADTVANEEREKEEMKQSKRHNEIMGVNNRIQALLQRLRAGGIYVVPQDLKQGTAEMFTQTYGTFVGFKFNKGYTLGSSTAIFATLDGRRKVELALSDQAINTIISATDIANRYSPDEIRAISLENWDSKVPTQTRQKRYIITGNLLQALVDTEKGEKTRGNLISFSTIDGETRQGILMGENFKLTDLRNSASLSSRLAQIREGKAVVSENGDVQIEKVSFGWQHRGQYELRVPKSKQRGGIYTMHPDLLKLIEGHNFITKGNNMVAYVDEADIAKVVDMLSRAPFNLTVLQESQLSDVSAEDTEVLYRGGETSVEGIVSAKDMAKLGTSDRQAVAEFIRNMPCAKISVIKNTDDVDSESDLSDEAKAELLSTVEAGDTVGAYCHQNKKIYIFANRSQREAVGFTLQSTLVHENAHYLADKMDDIDESYLNRFAEAVDQMPSMFFRNLREKLLSVGYDKDDLPGEIFALTLQWLFQKPKSIDRLKGLLSAADAKIFEKIITEQYGEEGRYKDTVIDGFKHRTDEEANLNGFSRANVEAGPGLGRDRGELGRGERDLSSESGFVDETIRDNANEYRNAEAVRGVLPGRSRGDASSAGIDGFTHRTDEIGEAGRDSGADLARNGDGYGAYSDAEVSYMNDPVSKVMGKNRFSKKRQAEFAARERQRMVARVEELASKLHLDKGQVEIVTDVSQLEGKRAKAKGFYNKRTGKITIVIPNNVSTIDAEQTLLHEAVAHYGLRQLFGEQFNTFLDNVYQSADESIRRKIAEMAAQNGWDFRTATEEYLAGLAEDTNFREAQSYTGWWSKIKRLFLDMLDKIGFEGFRDKVGVVLTDNELRYILWRSYQNLAEPGRYRSILGEATDVAKQAELNVGNYAEHGVEAEYAAEPIAEINSSYNNQIERWESGEMRPDETVRIGYPMGVMQYFMPNIPILLRQKVLSKSRKKHGLTAAEMKNLPEAIAKPIFVFKSNTETISILTTLKSENGNNLFVAIELEKDLKLGGHTMIVNDILTIHGREAQNIIEPILHNGTLKYVDKEKGLEWLSSASSSYQQEIAKQGEKSLDRLHSAKSKSQAITNQDLISVAKIIDSFENPTIEGEELFRSGDFSPRDRVYARYAYESVVRSGSYQFKEAVQDSMLGLKELYKAIDGAEAPGHKQNFRIEDVPGFENAYLFENRMSSMNAGEQHEYFQRYMQPLLKEIGRIAGANKRKRKELTDYIMAKHGLERNEYMRNEAAANGEDTNRDFAGLMGLTGEADWRSAEATAQQWVDDYESMVDTASLWKAINEATKATLEKVYLSGIISKETYEKILGMYDYYVPLRGWNETTSEQVYGYLMSKDGPLGGSIMKKAEGRESMADDPIATIGMMADDAIRQGNRNLMKQRFLNFVLNHPSDAVSVHDIWLEYNNVTGEWMPVFADVEDTDTADEVAQKVEDFEERMEGLRAAEPHKYKKGREAQHIPYKVVHGNLREHQILIKRNGRTFVVTINGNPRAAQAINGLTNPDVDQNGVVGNMLKAGTWVNRQLSAFYTTRNPDFVVGNFFRDMLYSNCMTWVKESPRYARRFHKNFGRVNPIVMRRLLGKWENGTLDMSNRLESLFYQFMKNGGETGYTNVRDIEGHKRAVAAELKKQGSTGRRVWTALGMQLDLLNRSAENCARFAAFVTSRDFGRSIDRAIYDAKEISVNFNKKGSGGKMVNANGQTALGKTGAYLSGSGRLLYVFWNAGVQGMTNFGRQAKLHPAKFSVGATALFTLGYVIPMLAQMLGGGDGDDDDKNAYYNLPEYVRRSNICFYAGDRWITIPLPIEYRAMYGMGELAHGVISGNERYSDSELARQMAAQVSQIMPLDMLEGGGGISPFIPSAAKPFTEAYILNKGWTGLPVYKDTPFNKNDPEWTKAYASADKHLVDFAKWLNETSGGDDFKKGSIDINPARIEYLLNGTFGGLFTFPNKLKKSAETAFGDRDFEWRNMPIANRLIKSGDDRTANRKLQNEYFKYLKEYEATGQLMRKYENADEDGIMGYAERINFLENSPEYARWEIFDEFKADIDAYREDISAETDKEERARLETEMYAVMRELVNALHDPAAYRNSEQE